MAGVSCREPPPLIFGGREHDPTTSATQADRAPRDRNIVGLSQGTKRVRRLDLVARARSTGAALAGASFIAGVAGAGALSGSPYPRPGAQPADVRRYFRGSPGAGRVSVVGQLVSAASLARFTASVAKLAGRSRRGSRGLRTAAVGGVLAATSLATSALRGGAHR